MKNFPKDLTQLADSTIEEMLEDLAIAERYGETKPGDKERVRALEAELDRRDELVGMWEE